MAFYEYQLSEDKKGYYFWFEYDEDLVRAIKQVPHIARRWEPEERRWFVDNTWFVDAKRFLDYAVVRNTGRAGHHGRERPAEQNDDHNEEDDWYQDRRRESSQDKRDWYGRSYHSQEFAQTIRPDPIAQAFATLHLQKTAPLPVIEAAWRVLCHLHHPDKGGTTEKMRDVNVAHDIAKKFAESQQ